MSKKDQTKIFLLAVIGTALFFISDFWYYNDWFKVSKVIFHRETGDYSLREIILNCDNLLLIGFLFYGVKKATRNILISSCFCLYMIDLLATCCVYTIIFSPDLETWNRWALLVASTVIFIVQCLYKGYKYFERINNTSNW